MHSDLITSLSRNHLSTEHSAADMTVNAKTCSGCTNLKDRAAYTGTQWKRGLKRRMCTSCAPERTDACAPDEGAYILVEC